MLDFKNNNQKQFFEQGSVPTIAHAGELPAITSLPRYLSNEDKNVLSNHISCAYCGIGDSGFYNEKQNSEQESKQKITVKGPTQGCNKLYHSTMNRKSAYPIHISPSILDKKTGTRKAISYKKAINIFAKKLLQHCSEKHNTLVYASGQVDYFAIFAMQEVFRLLGIRNLTGNAEHCLNAGAVHNEILTGQEGPFLTYQQGLEGENRLYILNGWNGLITHPPVYNKLIKNSQVDAFLFDVMHTETAQGLAKLGLEDQLAIIKSKSDPHIILAVAHYIFKCKPEAIESRFIEQYANHQSFQHFKELANSPEYSPEQVSKRSAPEPELQAKLLNTILVLAKKLIKPEVIPIVISSVGLSQSSGVVGHCLWGNLLAMLGKFGLNPDSSPLGGILRLPGQINAQSEVQALNRKYFTGRIPMEHASDAAVRMQLPEDAYQKVLTDKPRAALDYADVTEEDELFVFFGTQFEANMPNRKRWLKKLSSSSVTSIVIDPIPDPWSLENADLIIPSPPHSAVTKLYQNGEWRLTLSLPQKQAAKETRSDATIIYDVMQEITFLLEKSHHLQKQHSDLARHLTSGYLRKRFCHHDNAGLKRIEGEVCRAQLWQRIQDYLHGNNSPLYCSFDHADGTPILWQELLTQGSIIYGGVGVNRFVIDYQAKGHIPFRTVFRKPHKFTFFVPSLNDLEIPQGIIFNSGRSSLSDDLNRIDFAINSFNSGKATSIDNIAEENPLYLSHWLAKKLAIKAGDWVAITGEASQQTIYLPVVISPRIKGNCTYVSFHRSKAQENRQLYINDVTDHIQRCAYSSQVSLKIPQVTIMPIARTALVTKGILKPSKVSINFTEANIYSDKNLPQWAGEEKEFIIKHIQAQTRDSFTLQLMAESPCRFSYLAGQFCSIILNIKGQRVERTYSISSSPSKPFLLEITIKRVTGGLVSNWIADQLIVGDKIRLANLNGSFTLDAVPDDKILFIGAGSGVTPLFSMINYLLDSQVSTDIVFYYSVSTLADVIFKNELVELDKKHANFKLFIVTTQGSITARCDGLHGRINESLLDEMSADFLERSIYLCGSYDFMTAVETVLLASSFDQNKLYKEQFYSPKSEGKNELSSQQHAIEITFDCANKKVLSSCASTLLEVAEAEGIFINTGCRTGNCGACKVKIKTGDVFSNTTDDQTFLENSDRYTLACISYPRSDCIIEHETM